MNTQRNLSNLGEVDVIYRYQNTMTDRPYIKSSQDAVDIFKEIFKAEKMGLQEQFVVVFLNRAHQVIGCANLFMGGVASTIADVKIILAMALKVMSSAVLVAHNHPSGNLSPSTEDAKLTSKLKEALELMDMQLLDHVILGPDYNYLSFADEGLLS